MHDIPIIKSAKGIAIFLTKRSILQNLSDFLKPLYQQHQLILQAPPNDILLST